VVQERHVRGVVGESAPAATVQVLPTPRAGYHPTSRGGDTLEKNDRPKRRSRAVKCMQRLVSAGRCHTVERERKSERGKERERGKGRERERETRVWYMIVFFMGRLMHAPSENAPCRCMCTKNKMAIRHGEYTTCQEGKRFHPGIPASQSSAGSRSPTLGIECQGWPPPWPGSTPAFRSLSPRPRS